MSHKIEFEIGGRTMTIESGRLAAQANGAVTIRYGDSMVVCAACAETEPKLGFDFFPLTVEYREKSYAAGKIPGGFFKREGRPSEKETLSARVIDRTIRPLFPDGYFIEVLFSQFFPLFLLFSDPFYDLGRILFHPWIQAHFPLVKITQSQGQTTD